MLVVSDFHVLNFLNENELNFSLNVNRFINFFTKIEYVEFVERRHGLTSRFKLMILTRLMFSSKQKISNLQSLVHPNGCLYIWMTIYISRPKRFCKPIFIWFYLSFYFPYVHIRHTRAHTSILIISLLMRKYEYKWFNIKSNGSKLQ